MSGVSAGERRSAKHVSASPREPETPWNAACKSTSGQAAEMTPSDSRPDFSAGAWITRESRIRARCLAPGKLVKERHSAPVER